MEEHNITYFRNLWQVNMDILENDCKVWEDICSNNVVPDEVNDEIRTTVGLARLLMCQKLKQFRGLIDDSEFKTGEKEITCLDLQGFWDMVYHEVEKIQKSFSNLQTCKSNDWKFIEEKIEKIQKKKVPVRPVKKVESSNSHALAAKQRLAEIKKKMLAQRAQQKKQDFVEIQGLELVNNNSPKNQNEISNPGKSIGISPLKKFKEDVRQSPRIRKKVENDTLEITESIKENLKLNNSFKSKPSQRKSKTSVQDKENFSTPPTFKVQKKSKGNTDIQSSDTKRGKSKDFGPLQCLTRSAKRALMAQQD